MAGLELVDIKDFTLLLRVILRSSFDGSIEVQDLLKFKLVAVYRETQVLSKLKEEFSTSSQDFVHRQSLLTNLSWSIIRARSNKSMLSSLTITYEMN